MSNEKFPEGIIDFDEEAGQVILRHGDGQEDRFYVECELDVEGDRYIVLVSAEAEEEAEEVTGVVFQVTVDDEGEEVWMAIDDEEKLTKIEEVMALQEEEEN